MEPLIGGSRLSCLLLERFFREGVEVKEKGSFSAICRLLRPFAQQPHAPTRKKVMMRQKEGKKPSRERWRCSGGGPERRGPEPSVCFMHFSHTCAGPGGTLGPCLCHPPLCCHHSLRFLSSHHRLLNLLLLRLLLLFLRSSSHSNLSVLRC